MAAELVSAERAELLEALARALAAAGEAVAELARLEGADGSLGAEPPPPTKRSAPARRGPRVPRDLVVTDLDRARARKALAAKGMLPAHEEP